MINQAIELIKTGKYDSALKEIETALSKKYDLLDPEQEKVYTELLNLRITANSLMGTNDAIVLDAIRKEKYPSKSIYTLDGKHQVVLLYKSSFLFECDAYVNTISCKNPFEGLSDKSATNEILKSAGKENVLRQINRSKFYKKGDFVTIRHEKLSAPMSYHIFFYEDDKEDFRALEVGIASVLDDAVQRKLKVISFFPLGFNIVVRALEEDKNKVAEHVADKVAEIVVQYIHKNKSKALPSIYFNFVMVDTLGTFDRAFYKWTNMSKSLINLMRQLSEKEKNIIEQSRTKDEKYIRELKELCCYLDEKSSILILGETGVGKSNLAELIYKNSIRSQRPFIKVNCATIKPGYINQQLFGWKKGSYTDAKEDGVGAIEASDGGTLFLDEIGYTDMETQRMLLKFLDDGTYSRFGEQSKEIKVDVRLVFGTNVDLLQMIKEGKFAHDLYERIANIVIEIPPLRERRDDIAGYIEHFRTVLNGMNSKNITLSAEALGIIKSYNWPGNIRQLKNYFEKIYSMCKNKESETITCDIIKNNPPRNFLYEETNPMLELEKAIMKILSAWNPSDGKFRDDFLEPIIAKLYVHDLKGKVKESGRYLGIDGTRGEDSTLRKKLDQYGQLKEKFNL